MQQKQIQKNRTYPQDAVLCLENHKGDRGYKCSVEGCRDVWFYGDGDVRNFDDVGTVCATHGYLIPRMTEEEIKDKQIGYVTASAYWIHQKSKFETDMFPTIVYTSDGKQKEFISVEGKKRRDELDEFFRSRAK